MSAITDLEEAVEEMLKHNNHEKNCSKAPAVRKALNALLEEDMEYWEERYWDLLADVGGVSPR